MKKKVIFMIFIFFCPLIIGSTDLFKQGKSKNREKIII